MEYRGLINATITHVSIDAKRRAYSSEVIEKSSEVVETLISGKRRRWWKTSIKEYAPHMQSPNISVQDLMIIIVINQVI